MSDTELDSLRFQVRDLTARLDESRRTVLDLNRQVHEAVTERVTWHTRWEATDKALGEALASLETYRAMANTLSAALSDVGEYVEDCDLRGRPAFPGDEDYSMGTDVRAMLGKFGAGGARALLPSGPEKGLDGSGAPDVG